VHVTANAKSERHCARFRLSFSVGAETFLAVAKKGDEAIYPKRYLKKRLLHVNLITPKNYGRFAMTVNAVILKIYNPVNYNFCLQ